MEKGESGADATCRSEHGCVSSGKKPCYPDEKVAVEISDRWRAVELTWYEGYLNKAYQECLARATTAANQIHIICVIRPSVLISTIEYSTQFLGESPQAVLTVRMPLPTWEQWSKGAQDFADSMCEQIRLQAAAPGMPLDSIQYHCEKAGLNPGGSFFISMRYYKPE